MILLAATLAHAVDPAAVLARIDEIAPLRAERLVSGAPAIARAHYESAAAGTAATGLEGVDGVAAKKGYGVLAVDVPIARIWAAINDDAGKLARTKLGYAEILTGAACQTPRTVFQYLPLSLATDRWWVSDFRENTALASKTGGRLRELTWDSHGEPKPPETTTAKEWAAAGMPLGWTKGAWFLVDVDGSSTLIEYYAWSDPGGSLPAGLVSRWSAGSIVDTLQMAAALAADGPGCPIR